MKTITAFLFLVVFSSCGQTTTTLISPQEKIVVLPYTAMISEPAVVDTIKQLNSFLEIGNLWLVGARNGIYLIDNTTEELYRYFKFDIKSNRDLFDGQDSIVHFISTDFVLNKTNDKVLVITSNGIVFQIDLKKHTIDWLVKFVNRIETATYSDNGNQIAIGTRYDYKSKSGRVITEFYSSFFLISSNTGMFIDYFNENESVKKIIFINNDTQLLVAYDWNATDTYLWDIMNKQKRLAQFNEIDAHLKDIMYIGDNIFITSNDAGISKWEIDKPKNKKIIYKSVNFGSASIIKNRHVPGYIYHESGQYYSKSGKLIFFDNDIKLVDSLTTAVPFEDIQYSGDDNYIILENLIDKDELKTGFYYFDIRTKQVTKKIDLLYFNLIIQAIKY